MTEFTFNEGDITVFLKDQNGNVVAGDLAVYVDRESGRVIAACDGDEVDANNTWGNGEVSGDNLIYIGTVVFEDDEEMNEYLGTFPSSTVVLDNDRG